MMNFYNCPILGMQYCFNDVVVVNRSKSEKLVFAKKWKRFIYTFHEIGFFRSSKLPLLSTVRGIKETHKTF